MTEHKAQLVRIDSLKPYPGNPRRGNVEEIRRSLRINGQYRPVVVRIENRIVLAGNHTMEAAVEEGWEEIWATFISCDEQGAKRINLADNRTPELGGYDGQALLDQLKGLPDLEGTGWTNDEMGSLLDRLEPAKSTPSSGDGESVPGAGLRLAVLVVCTSAEHQEQVKKALDAARSGDMSRLAEILMSTQIQSVTV